MHQTAYEAVATCGHVHAGLHKLINKHIRCSQNCVTDRVLYTYLYSCTCAAAVATHLWRLLQGADSPPTSKHDYKPSARSA